MSDDMKPREPNCECNVEEGDSSCPVHGDCAWCGGLSPGCCKDARIATLEADLALARAEVAHLRAWQAWAHRELDRHEISGELPDDPEPVPPEGVAP